MEYRQCIVTQELKESISLPKEKIKEISDTFDGIVFEQLFGAPSVDIALKRYKLRKLMYGESK